MAKRKDPENPPKTDDDVAKSLKAKADPLGSGDSNVETGEGIGPWEAENAAEPVPDSPLHPGSTSKSSRSSHDPDIEDRLEPVAGRFDEPAKHAAPNSGSGTAENTELARPFASEGWQPSETAETGGGGIGGTDRPDTAGASGNPDSSTGPEVHHAPGSTAHPAHASGGGGVGGGGPHQNTPATILGLSTGDLTEDGSTDTLSGFLAVADPDPGESRFRPETVTGQFGTFSIDAGGHWVYHLDNSLAEVQRLQAGAETDEKITVKSVDGTSHGITITLRGAADAPILMADVRTAQEGGSTIAGQIIAHDVDAGETLHFSIATPVPGLTFGPDGSYTFDPSNPAYNSLGANAQQIVSIPVTVTDSTGLSDTKTLVITVTGTNDTPVLSLSPPQSLLEGAPEYRGNLIAQDIDTGDTLTFSLGAPVAGLHLDADGNFRFDAGDPAYDHLAFGDKAVLSIPVIVTDSQGATDTGSMQITVVGTNDAPILTVVPPQQVDEGATTVHGHLVASDVDDGDVLTYAVGQAVPGFSLAPDGSYAFDPSASEYDHLRAGEQQVLSIPVTVRDAHGAIDRQTLQITVTGTNDVPIVGGIDHTIAGINGASAGRLTAGGSLVVLDLDSGESHFIGQVLAGAYGTLDIGSDGHWRYSADAAQTAFVQMPQGSHLEETFTVRTADGTTHDIVVRIFGSNQPALIAGTRQALVQEDHPGSITHHLTIVDPDAGQAAFQPVDQDLPHGHFTLTADGTWTYQVDNSNPAVQALGVGDPLVERVTVGSIDGTPQVIEITIVGTNDTPVIGGTSTATITEDAAVSAGRISATGQLTISDIDAGEAQFTAVPAFPGDHGFGTFSIATDGTWTYVADNAQPSVQELNAGDRLTDSFQAISADGTRHTVTVTIEGTNDVPVVSSEVTLPAGTEDTDVTLTKAQLLAHATDADRGETAQLVIDNLVADHGMITPNQDGTYTFHPEPDYNGAVHFTFDVRDPVGASTPATATSDLAAVADAAVIGGQDTGTIIEDRATGGSGTTGLALRAWGQLTIQDPDAGEALFTEHLPSITRFGTDTTIQGRYGSLTVGPNGQWGYVAAVDNPEIQALGAHKSLTETLQVTSVDGTTHDIVITIQGTNDAPKIGSIATQQATEDGALLQGVIPGLDVDTTDVLTYSTTDHVPGFTLSADGTWRFDPTDAAYQSLAAGEHRDLSVTVTVTDSQNATATQTLTITVTGTNDGAVVGGVTSATTVDDDTPVSGTLTVSDADRGEDHFTAQQDVDGNYGKFNIDAGGHWTYTPDSRADAIAPGQTQREVFTVHTADGTPQVVTVTVTGSSDQSLSGDKTGAATEDGVTTLAGDIAIQDAGAGGTVTPHFGDHVMAGTYGSLDLRDQGHWIYSLDNQSPAVQGLKDGQVEEERFHITLPDGTTEDVVIRVTGTGDAPVIQTSSVQPPATLTDVDQITDFTGATDLSAFSELNQGVPVGTRIVGLYMPGSDQNLLANIAQGDLPTTHAAYDMGNFQAAGAGYQYLDQNQWFGQNLEGGTARFHALAPSIRNNFDGGLIVFDDGTVGRLVKVCDDDRANGPGDYVYYNKVDGVDAHTGVSVLSGKGTAGETVEVYEGTQRIGTATVDAQGHWRLGVPKLSDGDHEIHTQVAGTASEPLTVTVAGAQTDIHDPVPVLGAVTEDDSAAQQISGQMSVTDADANDHPVFTAQQDTDGAYGRFSIDADGTWHYTLDNTRSATQALAARQGAHETFIVQVTTDSGETVSQSVQITVTGTNDAPTISATPLASTEDAAAVSGRITGSDIDAGDTLSFATTASVSGFVLNADGGYTFDPSDPAYQHIPDGQQEVLTIPVTVTDGHGGSSTQNLVITVTGTNDAPIVTATPVAMAEDAAVVSGQIVGSDADTGDTLTYTTTASMAGFTLNADGSYTFDPSDPAYQHLPDGQQQVLTIPIAVTDESGASMMQDLVVTVTGTNDAPTASAASLAIDEDTSHTFSATDFGFADLDTGATLDHVTILSLPNAAEGQLLLNGQPVSANQEVAAAEIPHLVFQPVGNFNGNVAFRYTVSDGNADSTPVSGTMVVRAVDDLATISGDDQASITEGAGATSHPDLTVQKGAWIANGVPQETLPEVTAGDPNVGRWYTSGGSDADVHVDGLPGTLHFPSGFWLMNMGDPSYGFHGWQLFPRGDTSATAQFTAVPADASGDLQVRDVDSPVPTFIDVDSQTGDNGYGTFTMHGGHWTFVTNDKAEALPAGASATETFTFRTTDGTSHTVTVRITGSDTASRIEGDISADLTESTSGTEVQATGTVTIIDPDTGQNPSLPDFSDRAGDNGFGHFSMTNGQWTYVLDPVASDRMQDGADYRDQITIRASDGSEQTIVITISGSNDAPTVTATSISINEDAPHTFSVADFGFDDPDSNSVLDHVTITGLPDAAQGLLLLDGHSVTQGDQISAADISKLEFRPAQDFTGDATFRYTVSDQLQAASAEAVATITVANVNDAPTITGTTTAPGDLGATDEDTPKVFTEADLLRIVGASDIDTGDSLSVSDVSVDPATGRFASDGHGNWTFSPAADFHGDDVDVTIKVSDGHSETEAHGSLDILPVTDAARPSLTISAEQHVMDFPAGSASGVVSANPINAGAPMHGLTVDMTILGGQQVTSSASHGATFISYATPSDSNAFYIWRPENMKIRIGGTEYETGVAMLTDGQDHRYTFSWDGDHGTLDILIDGQIVKHMDGVGQGATLADGGKFALGNDQDSFGGGFSTGDAFTGKIFNTAIAKAAIAPADLTGSALANVLDGDPKLLTDIQADASGFRDATGHCTYTSAGAVSTTVVEVDTRVATPNPGATLKLRIDAGAPSDASDQVIEQTLSGFPAGTVVSDGHGHSVTVSGETEQIDVVGWTLDSVQAVPPIAFHGNMNIGYSVTTQGPDGATQTAADHTPIVLDPAQPIPDATITGDDTGTTPDDDTAVSGSLDVTDTDPTQAHFVAQTGTDGHYGSFSIDEQGQWTYAPDDRADALDDGTTATESFTVRSADGTAHVVDIEITGSDEGAAVVPPPPPPPPVTAAADAPEAGVVEYMHFAALDTGTSDPESAGSGSAVDDYLHAAGIDPASAAPPPGGTDDAFPIDHADSVMDLDAPTPDDPTPVDDTALDGADLNAPEPSLPDDSQHHEI
jgi:VCBS repeat-containing protein